MANIEGRRISPPEVTQTMHLLAPRTSGGPPPGARVLGAMRMAAELERARGEKQRDVIVAMEKQFPKK